MDNPSHTLGSVLSRLPDVHKDPALADRLDHAFGKHVAWLRSVCTRELWGFSPAEVEETVQDVLVTAWQKLPAYRGEGRFRTWLAGIARNLCRNLRRKKRDALSEDGLMEATSAEWSVLDGMLHDERDRIIQEAAAAVLDPTEQEVVELRYVQELDRAQIAERMGFEKKDEVRVVLQRCKRHLGKELQRRLAALGHGPSFWRE